MTIFNAARRTRAVQYDGSNGAEIVTLLGDAFFDQGNGRTATLAGADGTACTVNEMDGATQVVQWYVPINYWLIVVFDTGSIAILSNSRFGNRWMLYGEVSGYMTATPAFKSALASTASGFGSLPSITVPGLGNTNFDVPIRPMQPTNAFTAVPFLTGSSSLLGALSITGLTSGGVPNANKLTTVIDGVTWYDRVRVNVANSGALQLAGAALLVHVSP